eukprot:3704952-Alexandrium_andersonii.AAC.1
MARRGRLGYGALGLVLYHSGLDTQHMRHHDRKQMLAKRKQQAAKDASRHRQAAVGPNSGHGG